MYICYNHYLCAEQAVYLMCVKNGVSQSAIVG